MAAPAPMAYLAGFFDGEGSVAIKRNKRHSYILVLVVGNTDPTVLHLFHQHFGGFFPRPRLRPGWKPFYTWQASTGPAERCLRALLPHLRVKRAQAELALKFRKLMLQNAGHGQVPRDELRVRREAYRLEMKQLNLRGASEGGE